MKFPTIDETTLYPFQRLANFLAPKGLGRYTLALITGGMLLAFWTMLALTSERPFPVLSSSMVLAIMGAIINEMHQAGRESAPGTGQLPLNTQLRFWRYAALGMLLLLIVGNALIMAFGTREHASERALLLIEALFFWTLLSFASCKPYAPSAPPAEAPVAKTADPSAGTPPIA